MQDKELAGGTMRVLSESEIQEWRKNRPARLQNREGRRLVVEQSWSFDPTVDNAVLDPAGNPIIKKPDKPKPRSGREASEIMTQVMVKHLLHIKRHDPEAWRKKCSEIRAQSPSWYAHMTDEQLEDAIFDVCRRVLIEPLVQQQYERLGRGGGFREVAI